MLSAGIGWPAGAIIAGVVTACLPFGAAYAQEEVSFIAAGDVNWALDAKTSPPEYIFVDLTREDERPWRDLPFLNNAETIQYLRSLGIENDFVSDDSTLINYGLEFDSDVESTRYPLRKIAPVFRAADVAFANLETPLSDEARRSGAFRSPSSLASALSWAGVDVVSLANNHGLDSEGQGLNDTMTHLSRAGIEWVGAGKDLESARTPVIIERDGVRIAILGYTCHIRGASEESGFATADRSGVAPLNPVTIQEDVHRIRDAVDFVIVTFHWGPQNTEVVHPLASRIARSAIDAGADVILGHHPHVPQGIEIYQGRPIIHSLGNFIFGHNHTYWGHNILARLTFSMDSITRLEIVPVAGKGPALAQPYVLEGEEARAVLRHVQTLSEELGTRLDVEGDVGVVRFNYQAAGATNGALGTSGIGEPWGSNVHDSG